MTSIRTAILGLALSVAAPAPARAQQRPPRWGGEGNRSASAANQPQGHQHVAYRGSIVILQGAPYPGPVAVSQGQSAGGSWDGRRPTAGGSPGAQPRPRGTDLSAFFGYVPPRGETAQNARAEPAHRATAAPASRAPAPDTVQHHPRITWPRR